MLSDHARPLNPRGRHAAKAMARAMHDLGLAPDVVLVSSARRTLQTLEALGPWDEPPLIEPMDAFYLAPAAEILAVLRNAAPAARSILVVGHNPGLHELAVHLAGAHATAGDTQLQRMTNSYPSGALAEFSIATPWHEVSETGARLIRFLVPKDLTEVRA